MIPSKIHIPKYLPQIHTSLDIIDNSKMNDFDRCSRYFFFRNYLGWRPNKKELNLIFGNCIHHALEYIHKNDRYNPNTYIHAYQLFEYYYDQIYSIDEDKKNFPKNKLGAKLAIREYMNVYGDDSNWIVVDTEIWGDLLLEEDKSMRFRLDLIAFDKSFNGLVVIDHKTTGTTHEMYRKLYQQSNQMLAYLYASKSYFGERDVIAAYINMICFLNRKSEDKIIKLERFPIFPTDDTLITWKNEAINIYDRIINEILKLSNDSIDNQFMTAFPKRKSGCSMYNKLCPYFSVCSINNPLQIVDSMPADFVVDFWDPKDS